MVPFMSLLATIMFNPEFGEVCFLVAFILFALDVLVIVAKRTSWEYDRLLTVLALAFVALGWLAL